MLGDSLISKVFTEYFKYDFKIQKLVFTFRNHSKFSFFVSKCLQNESNPNGGFKNRQKRFAKVLLKINEHPFR